MNRYEIARTQFPPRMRGDVQRQFRFALSREPQDCTREAPDFHRVNLPAPKGGGTIYCLCTVEDDLRDGLGPEEHVSVSRGRGGPPPSWDDLVLVRSLAWDDGAEVVQVLPALTGPLAEE